LVFVLASASLLAFVGRDFFPSVDAGLVKLHVRSPPGTRIEENERRVLAVEDTVRTVVPGDRIETMIDNIGTPYSGINLSLSEGVAISAADADVLIALKEHGKTREYVKNLRKALAQRHPDTTFFFLAPDISTQVLNFGLASPIDVQIVGARSRRSSRPASARSPARSTCTSRRYPPSLSSKSTWTVRWPSCRT
jgi:multidrug efflux pump subunit AcrB